MPSPVIHHPSSYRDPSGFIFERDGVWYRQVNLSYRENFDHFIQSGCYDHLVKSGLLLPHEVADIPAPDPIGAYKVLRPEQLKTLSFSYEWSFDMFRDAALLTLELVQQCLKFDVILKDATPFNVQWHKGKLVFIDSLSFEKYEPVPWIAYRQFCENFLGPLLVMHYSKKQMPGLMLAWPDGIPLSIVSSLLPRRSRFSLHVYLHIHLHAKIAQRKNNGTQKSITLPKQKLLNLLSSLEMLVKRLKSPTQQSTWSEYYDEAAQRQGYLETKKKVVTRWLTERKNITTAVDLGANEGEFSKLLAEQNIDTVAVDDDPYCISRLYNNIKSSPNKKILPLVVDLSNPSPSTGVNNKERDAFIHRVRAELVLALALIHHLVIGKNIPFRIVAEMMKQFGSHLIIEFVPKEDEKVQLMLRQKKDIYPDYSEEQFLRAFSDYFTVVTKEKLTGSGRTLYLMKRNEE